MAAAHHTYFSTAYARAWAAHKYTLALDKLKKKKIHLAGLTFIGAQDNGNSHVSNMVYRLISLLTKAAEAKFRIHLWWWCHHTSTLSHWPCVCVCASRVKRFSPIVLIRVWRYILLTALNSCHRYILFACHCIGRFLITFLQACDRISDISILTGGGCLMFIVQQSNYVARQNEPEKKLLNSFALRN